MHLDPSLVRELDPDELRDTHGGGWILGIMIFVGLLQFIDYLESLQ